MNLDKTQDYKAWLQAFTKKYPSIPASKLMYRDADGNNPCRDNLGGDLNDIFIPYELTLSIGHLPESYSILELNVTGSNNTLSDINMAQVNTAPVATATIQATQTAEYTPEDINKVAQEAVREAAQNNALNNTVVIDPETSNTEILFLLFLVIVICIIGGGAVWYFNRKKRQNKHISKKLNDKKMKS